MTVTDTPPTTELEVDGSAAAPEALAQTVLDEGVAEEPDLERPSARTAVAIAFPNVAAAIMVGGVFLGISPRFYAAISGLLGIGLGFLVAKVSRKPFLSYVLILFGMFAIGLLMLLPDVGDIFSVTKRVNEATATSSVLQPPVDFDPGWKAIVGWTMGLVGFGTAWVALVLKWRSASLLLPLPIAAIAGISVPEAAQVPSGLAVLVLFAIGLGLISSEQAAGDDEESRPSLAYEVRKAVKAVPLIAVITLALYLLSQTNFLFPDPIYDPAQEPQKPKTQPLSDAQDRVLFEVIDTELTGPFRMGSLDVYDGKDWRLPPFAASKLVDVPKDGIVDKEFRNLQQLEATFVVKGLGGAVLPSLPNTVGIAAKGPKLAYDARNGNIRLVNGKAEAQFTYKVTAAGLPKVSELEAITFDKLPRSLKQFTEIPDAPPAVQGLLDQAPDGSAWAKFDFLRNWILGNLPGDEDGVTAKGTGQPKSVTPERVADMIAGSREGTPYEIVAAQAMLARWVGIPSRIGYGFDGGDKLGDVLQVRPRHGAAFPEVYFPGFKWLPVIGVPKQAEPTVGGDPSKQRLDPLVQPSNDVGTKLYLPVIVPPASVLARQIASAVLLAVPIAFLIFLAYALFPLLRKARLRSARRRWALERGVRERVALAYAEWRDYATDLGFEYSTDTPLMFLDRFVEDEEHQEMAWLTTRVLWGDLRDDADLSVALMAEELSRSLRRRLGSTQPTSLRAVAAVSRLSLRRPFDPNGGPPSPGRRLPSISWRKEPIGDTVPA